MNLVEVMLVLLTLSVLSGMIIHSIRRFSSAHAYAEGQARMREVGDRVIWQVSDDAALAAHVFTATSHAAAYLGKCGLGAMQPASPKAPTCTERGYFEKDTAGNATTGNFLLVARASETFLADLSGDRSRIATVTIYRFVLWLPVVGQGQTLDLARWVSVPLARLNDLERVTDPVQRTVLGQKLFDDDVRYAWEPGRPVAGGLVSITPSGNLQALTPNEKLPGEGEEVRPALFAPHRMAVARNGALPNVAVPLFALIDGGFPGGFEVKVDGNASGRMVLVRLVITQTLFDGNRGALVFCRTTSNRGTT